MKYFDKIIKWLCQCEENLFFQESEWLYTTCKIHKFTECYLRQFSKKWNLSQTELIEKSKEYCKICKQ